MDIIQEAAKRVLMKLTEIQPAMTGKGLNYEADLIREMKDDLSVVIWGEKPDPLIVKNILDSQFSDVMIRMDHFLGTLETLGQLDRKTLINSAQFEVLLQLAMYSAENFAARTADFLASKQSFQHVFGGDNATN